ncbi:hypothetical protein J7J74_00325 [bacterium]|nr:hypothetical protein [bacterium]
MNYINLLPKVELQQRNEEKKLRLILVIGSICLFLLIFLLLLIFIFEIKANNYLEEAKIELAEKKVELFQVNQLEKRIRKMNSTFKQINKFYQNQIFTTEVFKTLTFYFEPGMSVQGFNFSPETGKGYLLGYAKNLESLERYRDKLKERAIFKKVEIEILGFLKTKDVTFRLDFEYGK